MNKAPTFSIACTHSTLTSRTLDPSCALFLDYGHPCPAEPSLARYWPYALRPSYCRLMLPWTLQIMDGPTSAFGAWGLALEAFHCHGLHYEPAAIDSLVDALTAWCGPSCLSAQSKSPATYLAPQKPRNRPRSSIRGFSPAGEANPSGEAPNVTLAQPPTIVYAHLSWLSTESELGHGHPPS